MHDDKPSPEDQPDTEGHAFKWSLEDDGKGGKRPRQGWTPTRRRLVGPSARAHRGPRRTADFFTRDEEGPGAARCPGPPCVWSAAPGAPLGASGLADLARTKGAPRRDKALRQGHG
jgi:hypothetical protein